MDRQTTLQCISFAVLISSLAAPISAADCVALNPNGPLQITTDCTDPLYGSPVIDLEEKGSGSTHYHRIAGHFNGTNVDFSIYLPKKSSWKGHFFQLTYPSQNSTASSRAIAFGADSGAYTVQAAGTQGYRADAALAKFSREIARAYYQESSSRQIHGYLYGGSGGSYTTVAAMENTIGVWDGAVILIQAIPISIPNNWCIRAFGSLVLGKKKNQLIDAVSPGGSGDPFSVLNNVERAALKEVSALGLPLSSLENFDGVFRNQSYPGGTGLWDVLRLIAVPNIRAADPTFSNDFWTQPGYLGTKQSSLGDIFRNSLIEFNATVQHITQSQIHAPVAIALNDTPSSIDTNGLEFNVISANGDQQGYFTGALDLQTNEVVIHPESNTTVVASITNGSQLYINNRWYLAIHSYYRHQVPESRDFYGYDFLRDADGRPHYPQRSLTLGPGIARASSGGGTHTGNVTGKIIVIDNLQDYDAFPWHADWYRNQVQRALGDRFSNHYRLYYEEHADHHMGPIPADQTGRVIDWTSSYEQMLNDLSAWVEEGKPPPKDTQYTVQDGQIILPATAKARYGFQPVVELTVNGRSRAEVHVGDKVTFKVYAEAPPSTGSIVSLEWDFEGTGHYVKSNISKLGPILDTKITHRYLTGGIYLPAVRVALQREGDPETQFRRVLNLGRARVIVNYQ
ncbi:hypothetical protein BU24DRAFT_484461 [Aaosphaeria arxii CBS 175.79]|uniref:PKD domain-containing protein n=1 Tax=Aaosphaeria arxii CBS 175.79 TaxID=1450172 RepID=A0A6A5XKA7_9PLEO|nr:uncharacterized protein BU24DRAFT_484461 [Aaosphaeria arxii CBS 175.79]KAF2012734.1 hypothetical protein BU24DRAFT_484461 [Aaosphaeria arxii CBS 175.79]